MDSNKLKLYVENEVKQVLQEATVQRFYHASNSEFMPGKTYKARKNEGFFDPKIERLIEKLRPSSAPSRFSSFFLVKQTSMLDIAGAGSTAYVYVVTAKNPSRHHFGWLQRAMGWLDGDLGPFDRNSYRKNKERIDSYVDNYWSGKPWRYDPEKDIGTATWEYLAPAITVIKEKN